MAFKVSGSTLLLETLTNSKSKFLTKGIETTKELLLSPLDGVIAYHTIFKSIVEQWWH